MKKLIMLLVSLSFLACTEVNSPSVVPPAEPLPEKKVEKTEAPKQVFNPMVDILFVLDDSKSMAEELATLRKNIHDFVVSFGKNQLIDYHLGAVKVHDSSRYNNQVVQQFNPKTGERHYFGKGELVSNSEDSAKFMTRSNETQQLEALFDFDVHWQEKDSTSGQEPNSVINTYARGPEIEESFSPVLTALTDSALLNSSNKGFHRKGSHLVVIFITDAEDSSPNILPLDLYNQLLKLKDGQVELLSAYGVLCMPGDKQCLTLKNNGVDTIESEAKRIREFIEIVAENKLKSAKEKSSEREFISPILDLRANDWGHELAKIGAEIRRETIEKPIQLTNNPEFDISTMQPKIRVYLGEKELPYDAEKGWTYLANTNTVIIHEGVDFNDVKQPALLRIEYTKVRKGPKAVPVKN